MTDVENKKVIIAGTGKSGIGSAVLLEKNGALPLLYDSNENTDIDAVKKQISEKLGYDTKAQIVTGKFPEDITKDAELAVLSPGVPTDADFVLYMKEKDIHIWVKWNLRIISRQAE